jgi:sec-independent protein translocase protein TatC
MDFMAEKARLAAGDSITVRVVDADEVGELPLLAAMVLVGALALVLTLAWHQLRPPVAKPDDEPMKFLDHLVELQARLLPPVLWFAFLNVFYFVAGLRVVHVGNVPVVVPTLSDKGSLAARAFDAFAARQVPTDVTLVVLRPIDAVLAEVQVALFLAFVTTLPLLLYELVAFIGPALRDRERQLAVRTIPVILILFLIGAWFGYVEMSPLMIRTLYDFAPAVGAQSFLAVGDLVSFALVVVLAFGAAFELPVLMYALSRFGVVKAATWRKYVRHAIVAIVVIAGIITPDPSPVSQMLVAVPVTALYLVGMGAAALAERRRGRAAEAAAAGLA